MNKRIKELYQQVVGKDWAYDFDPQVAEKFAELIIQECAEVAWQHWLEDQDSSAETPILNIFNIRSK
jgi:hypothetical protein